MYPRVFSEFDSESYVTLFKEESLRHYLILAKRSLDRSVCLFPVKPKFHVRAPVLSSAHCKRLATCAAYFCCVAWPVQGWQELAYFARRDSAWTKFWGGYLALQALLGTIYGLWDSTYPCLSLCNLCIYV